MPRANRFHLPGAVWHLTHRCHNRQFLFKFEQDRQRWKYWLFQARTRYGLSVLNYIVTSNHIHLLVQDGQKDDIARSMQLIAGRTAQEYNQRKSRRGAFWEDRYFATAISTDQHLIQCLVYIDLNMVRAGTVEHPSQWNCSGYREIQSQPKRYRIIDTESLCRLTHCRDELALQKAHQQWVADALKTNQVHREPLWTESVAVGSESYIELMKSQLGFRAYHRKVKQQTGSTFLIQDAALPRK
jgi:putative transposase